MTSRSFASSSATSLSSCTTLQTECWFAAVIFLVMLPAMSCQTLAAQENYLVVTSDGVGSLYDLATNTFIESIKGNPLTYNVATGANNRLAFEVGGIPYASVVDTTIAREVARIQNVSAPSIAMAPDGKSLLAGDYEFVLNIIDTAQLKVVKKIDLRSILNHGLPGSGFPGPIVPVASKAYVFPRGSLSMSSLAIVDLTNYSVSSIPLPDGSIQKKAAAVTPDGSTVVAFVQENSDHKSHVLLISTTTNTIVGDIPQTKSYPVQALVVTPNGSDPNGIIGYLSTGGMVIALDLRTNSPTYGQLLPSTTVTLGNGFYDYTMAVNSDGSRLILAGYPSFQDSPNVNVVDTSKMFTDPAHALIAQVTVNDGIEAEAVCTGFFPTTPPPTAPTVSGVSGDITNDADHQIQVTGGNFLQGALVRIGNMGPLPATVNGSSSLTVTVPANAPAGKALDIVVTNPQTNSPPDQQNQSGLLAGKFNILLNPKFQPTTQFATVNTDGSFSVYDLNQRTMVNVESGQPGDFLYWPTFNVDGKELYLLAGQEFGNSLYGAIPVRLSDNAPGNAISLDQNAFEAPYQQGMASSYDPNTGKPVVYIPWADDADLHLSKIDSDPNSPSFNTIIQTFNAGFQNQYQYPYPSCMTVTPDGKFSYVWYETDSSYLGIFDLSTGAFHYLSAADFGVPSYWSEWQISITPDGKSLLLMTYKGNRPRVGLFDISQPTQPKRVWEFTPVPVPGRGFPYVENYQVVGGKLYAIDPSGIVVVFNFDRQKGDFRELGYYVNPDTNSYWYGFAFSTDGAYMYVSDELNDQISILDTSKLPFGKDVLLTNLRAPYAPEAMDISPVAPPTKSTLLNQRDKQPTISRFGYSR